MSTEEEGGEGPRWTVGAVTRVMSTSTHATENYRTNHEPSRDYRDRNGGKGGEISDSDLIDIM